MITITALPSRVIGVGRVGENEHRRVAFDISEYLAQYPDASFGLIHSPSGVTAYPVATVAVENDQLIWTVTSSDVTSEGQGRCELIVREGDTIAKSVIYMTQVLPALDGAGEAPEPWESWQEQMIGIAADVDASADRAEAASHAVQDMGATATTLEPGADATVTKTTDPETGAVTLAFGIPTGPQGPAGEPGQDGAAGRNGVDGVSPTASVTQTATGAVVTVTDASGTTTATLTNGQDGQNGYSPSVEVTEITGGHRVVVYDAEGGNSFDVMDGAEGQRGPAGQDGQAGQPGEDGFSPTASVTKVGSTATITITDKDGTTTATVNDGAKGDPGDDYVLTAQDKADIAALVTPEPVTVSGSTPSITAQANTRYVCGTVSTLTFTPSATGICDVRFTSGSTATVLTVPITVLWPDWFDPSALEANTVYEINIMDGKYGAVAAWT